MLKRYNNMKLGNRLLLCFLVISIVPLLIVGLLSFSWLSEASINDAIEKKSLVLDSIESDIYDFLHDNESIVISTVHNADVIGLLKNKGYQSKTFDFNLSKALYDSGAMTGFYAVALFDAGGTIVYTNADEKLRSELAAQAGETAAKSALMVSGIWGNAVNLGEKGAVLPYFRRVKDYQTNEVLGVFVSCIDGEGLLERYEKYIKERENIVVVNKEGFVVSSSILSLTGRKLSSWFSVEGERGYRPGCIKGKAAGETCLAVYAKGRLGFTYYYITPESILLKTPRGVMLMTLVVMAFAIGFVVIVSRLVSSSVAKPIVELAKTMDGAETMKLPHSLKPQYNDEVGALTRSFVDMMERLEKSNDRVREAEEAHRLARYNALKFQINPHFLYNTLSTIVWLSKKGYVDEVIALTRSLSTLFRVGISKDSELITIGDEVEHVKSYLDIQSIRYSDSFKYIIDIEPELTSLYIVKIVLQPLVENAIYHGVRDMEKPGIIKITGRLERNCVALSVMDNGDNMDEERANRLNEFLRSNGAPDSEFGIGIKNVHERITYYFGPDYGLEYSRENQYTVVRVSVPVKREP